MPTTIDPASQLFSEALGQLRPGAGRLAGRRILVVGAGQRDIDDPQPPVGNGRAISLLFAHEGATLTCVDVNPEALATTCELVREAGGTADGKVVGDDPIGALAAEVSAVDGREAIILTRSHVVSEFFHLDWTSRARRKIGVPVLHLLEHESFDEQAGGGEGVTGV